MLQFRVAVCHVVRARENNVRPMTIGRVAAVRFFSRSNRRAAAFVVFLGPTSIKFPRSTVRAGQNDDDDDAVANRRIIMLSTPNARRTSRD